MNFEEDSSDEGDYEYKPGFEDDYDSEVRGIVDRIKKINATLILLLSFSLITIVDANEQAALNDVNALPAFIISLLSILLILVKLAHSCTVDDGSAGFQVGIGIALVILWFAGVVALTFVSSGTFGEIISSGFFSTWGSFLVSAIYLGAGVGAADENGNVGCDCCCGLDLKDGITGNLGVSILLSMAVITFTALNQVNPLAIMAMILAILIMLILFTMICVPYKSYSDLDKFTIVVVSILFGSYLIILMTTFGAPFANRNEENGKFELNGNGYFSVIGLFVALISMFWSSHVYTLYYNRDEGGSFGAPGRYIWLALLFLTSIVIIGAGGSECINLDGCDIYSGALLALGFYTFIIVPLTFYVGRYNVDNGDDQILSPGSGFDFFDNNFQRLEFISGLILQIFWIAAGAIFTFSADSPFNSASNGYFFTWFGFFFASQYFTAIYPKFSVFKWSCLEVEAPNGMTRKGNLGIGIGLFGNVVQVISVLVVVILKIEAEEEIAIEEFAAFGCQTIMFVLLLLLLICRPEKLGCFASYLSYTFLGFAILQLIVTTVILTPFDNAEGNGFFAAWIILFGAYINLDNYELKIE